MICSNCKQPIKFAPEQVGVDERQMPIYHRFGYCDKCMVKWDMDVFMEQQQEYEDKTQKSESPLSVVTCVIGFVLFLMPMPIFLHISLAVACCIVSLVDLCLANEKYTHIGSIFGFITSIVVTLLIYFGINSIWGLI